MSFILFVMKKHSSLSTLDKKINLQHMRNVDMPTFPAKSCTEFWLDNALLFSWEHESHVSSDSIINDNKRIYALIGTAVDLDSLASDAKSIYTKLDIDRNSDSIQGDYLCFSIDEYGNGKCA